MSLGLGLILGLGLGLGLYGFGMRFFSPICATHCTRRTPPTQPQAVHTNNSLSTLFRLTAVTDGYTYGGVAFQVQPRIQVLDAGGNLLVDDSESVVEVTFTTNPR